MSHSISISRAHRIIKALARRSVQDANIQSTVTVYPQTDTSEKIVAGASVSDVLRGEIAQSIQKITDAIAFEDSLAAIHYRLRLEVDKANHEHDISKFLAHRAHIARKIEFLRGVVAGMTARDDEKERSRIRIAKIESERESVNSRGVSSALSGVQVPVINKEFLDTTAEEILKCQREIREYDDRLGTLNAKLTVALSQDEKDILDKAGLVY